MRLGISAEPGCKPRSSTFGAIVRVHYFDRFAARDFSTRAITSDSRTSSASQILNSTASVGDFLSCSNPASIRNTRKVLNRLSSAILDPWSVKCQNPDMATNLTVRDVMQIRVHVVHSEMPLLELEREFLSKRVSGFPVVDNGKLVGLVSRSDVVRQLVAERQVAETTSDFYWDQAGFHEEPAETIQQIANRVGQRIEDLRIKDLMSRHVVVLGVDDSIEVAAQKFLDHHIHRAPVVENGRLVGILGTLELVRLIANQRVAIG